jgi:hypothetical protein
MSSEPDLHVESVTFKLVPEVSVVYNDPPPIDFASDLADFRLADGKLRCTMKKHFDRPDEAQRAIEPILRAWEVSSDIRSNRGAIRFRYDTANVIDRTPSEPGKPRNLVLFAQSIASAAAFGTVTVTVGMKNYPQPLLGFRLNPDAESLWLRYVGYLERREPLQSMAYFCLTLIESMEGGRQSASRKYRVSVAVLKKLAHLSSERGDRLSARKAIPNQTPLAGTEAQWIEAAIKMLILRVGLREEIEDHPWIDLGDLPKLESA